MVAACGTTAGVGYTLVNTCITTDTWVTECVETAYIYQAYGKQRLQALNASNAGVATGSGSKC
jgi:hypothetical protein